MTSHSLFGKKFLRGCKTSSKYVFCATDGTTHSIILALFHKNCGMDEANDDFMELIQAKGKCLEGFKREYIELKKQHDLVEASVVGKERELEAHNAEISAIRDQISFIHKNVDEVGSSQSALKEAIDHMTTRKSSLIERELANREEIAVYTKNFEELKAVLALGPDWTPEQMDQKQTLQKEKDFLVGKLEAVTLNVSRVRQEVDTIYETIHQLEKDIADKDELATNIVKKTKEHLDKTKELVKYREEREKLVFDLREGMIKSENDQAERRRLLKGEDRTLQDLDVSLQASKSQMEAYLAEYDALWRTLQDLTNELERQKNHNRKIEEEIQEKEKVLQEKADDIAHFTKEGQISLC